MIPILIKGIDDLEWIYDILKNIFYTITINEYEYLMQELYNDVLGYDTEYLLYIEDTLEIVEKEEGIEFLSIEEFSKLLLDDKSKHRIQTICLNLSLNKSIQEYKKELCRLEMISQIISLNSEEDSIKRMHKCILDKIRIRKNND